MEEEQKTALFEGICELPDLLYVKNKIYCFNKIEEIKERDLKTFASAGLIKNWQLDFEQRGLEKKEIEKKINDNLQRLKDAEIQIWEKKLNG